MDAKPLIRVDSVDPLVLVCALCGWVPPGYWPAQSTAKLLMAVIEHWRSEHLVEAR